MTTDYLIWDENIREQIDEIYLSIQQIKEDKALHKLTEADADYLLEELRKELNNLLNQSSGIHVPE